MKNELQYNRHHTLFPRTEYSKYETSSALRQHPAMIHKIPVYEHNDLHAEVPNPLLISKQLARVALRFLDEQPGYYSDIDKFVNLTDRFYRLGKGLGRIGLEASSLSENFNYQLEFMGKVYDE